MRSRCVTVLSLVILTSTGGFAHALAFAVDGVSPGPEAVKLAKSGSVTIQAKVAFSNETPKAVAQGVVTPKAGKRVLGDTVQLHVPRTEETAGGTRLVEAVVNGKTVAGKEVPADGKIHELSFKVPIVQSSWVALRQFPQMHTNPVNVLVEEKPIRASRESAQWCIETIRQLWSNRARVISPTERPEAERTFERAIKRYEQIAREAESGKS